MLARAFWLTLVASSLTFAAPAVLFAQDDETEQDGEDDADEDPESAGGDKPDAKQDDKKPKRPIDKDSPTALALSELLHVEPNFGKDDKRVELTYLFGEEVEMEDWAVAGYDRVEAGGGVLLASGSQRAGLFLHSLHMKGEYEVEFECSVEWMAPSSQVVFLFGDGKSGGLWGNGWCKRTSRGYKPVSKRVAHYIGETRSKYNASRVVKIKYVVGSGKVACLINGVSAGDTKRLKKLTGRIGIFCKNIRLRVNRISIKGEIDASKL